MKKLKKMHINVRDSKITSMIDVRNQNVLQEKLGQYRPFWGHWVHLSVLNDTSDSLGPL